MADANVRTQLEKVGYVVLPPRDQAAVNAYVAADREVWSKVITAQKITVDN